MVKIAATLAFLLLGLSPASAAERLPSMRLDAEVRAALTRMTRLTERPPPALVGKVVVVGFFASWCPPCRPEFDQLNRLHAAYPEDRVAIVAVNLFEKFFEKDGVGRMRRFLKSTAPAFAVLGGLDDDALAGLFGGVERIPTVHIYRADGTPAYAFINHDGAAKTHATFDDLAAAIAPLLE